MTDEALSCVHTFMGSLKSCHAPSSKEALTGFWNHFLCECLLKDANSSLANPVEYQRYKMKREDNP